MLRSALAPDGAVAGVADAVIPGEGVHRRWGEHVGDETGVLVQPYPAAVADCDSGGLLATMLQGEQAEEDGLSDAFTVGCRDTEHAALLVRYVGVDVQIEW